MLTAYGTRVGIDAMRQGMRGRGIRLALAPVNYWRTIEFRLCLEAGRFEPGHDVLDIGSPKLFPLHLADELGARVWATDVDDYFIEELQQLRSVRGIPDDRLVAEVQDARALTYDDDSFDRVVSISVLEHIGPGGDSDAVREIARVLRPGGRAVITVPFDAFGGEIRKPADEVYWVDDEMADESGTVFFEHHYNEDDLRTRLLEASTLVVESIDYIGEAIDTGDGPQIWERLPRASAPLQPILSKLIHRGPAADWRSLRRARAARLVLTKPR